MKKTLLLLLILSLILCCFVSCRTGTPNETTSDAMGDTTSATTSGSTEPPVVDKDFVSPNDEESTVYTVTKTDENGLKLEVTLHGYKSKTLGKDFYVKNNEYFLVDVKLTNESENAFYQWLPTTCRSASPSHNHEIGVDISHGEYKLASSSFGFACAEMIDTWMIEAGETYEWQLKLAAGEQQSGKQDLPADGTGYSAGIKLYGEDIFTDNSCDFDGKILTFHPFPW